MVVAFIYLLSYHLSFKARVVSILNLLLEFWNLFAPFVLLYLYDLGTLLAQGFCEVVVLIIAIVIKVMALATFRLNLFKGTLDQFYQLHFMSFSLLLHSSLKIQSLFVVLVDFILLVDFFMVQLFKDDPPSFDLQLRINYYHCDHLLVTLVFINFIDYLVLMVSSCTLKF